MKLLDSTIYRNDIKRIVESFDLSLFNNKTILIVGGLGLIGSSIVDILLVQNKIRNSNIKIIIADLYKDVFDSKYGGCTNIDFLEFDANQMCPFLDIVYDYAIYAAGIANPDLYQSMPFETMTSNILGLISFLTHSKKINSKALLYLSSSEVYGTNSGHAPHLESEYGVINLENIRSCYPIAKKASEMLLKSFASEYDLNCFIVRPGHVYGPSASKNDKRVSSLFCHLAANQEDIVLKSSGSQIRSYCYSLDCANILLQLLLKGKKGESYNIGSDEPISIYTMADYISKYSNVNLIVSNNVSKSDITNFNPMDDSSLDCGKIANLDCHFLFNYREGFSHTIDIIKEMKK